VKRDQRTSLRRERAKQVVPSFDECAAAYVASHMLRHSTGYKLANDGQDTRAIQAYLGHRSIMSPSAIRP